MIRLLFLGLGHLSRTDTGFAADFARQLPRDEFRIGFLATAEAVPHLRDLGLPALPLDGESPQDKLAALDSVARAFRPDHLVVTDIFSLAAAGLRVPAMRERYGVPVAGFDPIHWQAAGCVVDFYAGHLLRISGLLDDYDLVIRPCPVNRPAAGEPGVVVTRLIGGGLRDGGLHPPAPAGELDRPAGRPVIFLVNSGWEYANITGSTLLGQLIDAMPGIVHSHLAALGRPLRVVHVGPRTWDFPIAEHLEYRHFSRLPQPMFHEQLAAADLFLTANVTSVTLAQAVLAGVPSLVLQNHRILDLERLAAAGCEPAWLRAAAPGLTKAGPFRVFPWGWHDLLAPVLADNPYTGCFRTAGVFERGTVLRELTALLDDPPSRTALHEAQLSYRDRLATVAAPAEAFRSVVSAR